MKPVFGIDITTNKKNERINSEEFVIQTTSKEKAKALEAKQETLLQTVEESKLPLWIRIVKAVCGFYALIVIVGVIKALPDVGFDQALRNAPILIISGFLALIAWLILQFVSKRKEKRVMTEQNTEQQIEALDTDIQNIYEELNVPDDAAPVDVLLFRYKEKNGKIIPKAIGLQMTEYMNLELKIFKTEDSLCLADLDNLFAFPLSSLQSIQTVKKRIIIPSWNKDTEPTKDEFKPYKMGVDQYGRVHLKSYHILTLMHNGRIHGIYFPCYELPTFERLTGLKAEEPQKQ